MATLPEYTHTSPDQRMIEAQARIISGLHNKVRYFEEKNNELLKQQLIDGVDAAMYRDIIKFVQSHPMLQSIWDELITAMRLIDPEKFK